MKKVLSQLIFILSFFLIVSPAYAMTTRTGQNIDVAQDEVVTGTLFAGGNTVTIDGTVNGDLFCAGQNVTIVGDVNGDVICAGQTVRVGGTVSGSLRAAGQMIDVSGKVKRNVTAVGQTLTLDKAATVVGEVIFGGQQLNNESGVRAVSFFKPSETNHGKTPTWRMPNMFRVSPLGVLWRILGYIVLAVILTALFPAWTKKITDFMQKNPWPSIGGGCLTVIAIPITVMVLAITIIGIPFALLLVFAFILAVAIARILAALVAGTFILDNLRAKPQKSMLLPILVGVAVSWVVFSIPVLGWLVSFLAVLWGLGGIIASRKK